MSRLTLHGWDHSTYTRSVLLALLEKGLDYDLITVDPFAEEGLPADYAALQPFGKIPALVNGDFRIYETTAILSYLEEAFEGPSLLPTKLRRRARMQQIIAILDSYGYRALVWDIFVNLREGTPDEALLARGRKVGRTLLAELADKMEGPLLCGEAISLADCHLAPILCYGLATPEGRELVAEQPAVLDWWERVQARPGWSERLFVPPR